MFVAIDNKDMDFLKVDAWINESRDNTGGKVISPELAMDVLSKTNHYANIKKVLTNIKKNCTTKEQLEPYKEFILSCVDEREMSVNALKDLQTMVGVLGEDFEKEFDDANSKPKFYGAFDCEVVTVTSEKEFVALEGEELNIYFHADKVSLRYCNMSKVKGLKFKERADVDLCGSTILPQNLDVSMCSKVDLSYCDLSKVKELKFRDGAIVDLQSVENLSCDVDVSMCSTICLNSNDLNQFKNLKFREGAKVYLEQAANLPKDLDVSMCSLVDMYGCDLSEIKELKFKEGAEVYLDAVQKMPSILDVSKCAEVNVKESNFGRVKELRVRDEAQRKAILDGDDTFRGQVVYVGKDGIVPVVSPSFDMDR